MLISDKLKLIFIQIPKTGSSALRNAILAKDPSSRTERDRHNTLTQEIVDQYPGYFKIVVVRNTYERLSSWYRFESKVRLRTNLCFKSWLIDTITRYNDGDKYVLCPFQVKYFSDENGVLVDKVIHYDNVKKDVFDIGIEMPEKSIDGMFFGDYDHYQIYQHRENVEVVNEYYKEELNYFNWEII
jgi:hypothetical protein